MSEPPDHIEQGAGPAEPIGSPAQDGRPAPAHIHCAACDELITPDQYPTAFCWTGPLEGGSVAAHGACLGIYLEIEAGAALEDI